MTNKEAIEILKKYKDESEEDYWVKRAEALGKGIEALENQKSVIEELEKIQEEIWNKRSIDSDFDFYTSNWCINLIDKYISELKGENKWH